MKVAPSFLRILKVVLSMILPASWQKASSTWTGNLVSKQNPLRVHTRLWSLTADQASGLLKACRAHKTTITSFLHTMCVAALGEVLQPHSKQYKYIATSIPVSLRRFTSTPTDTFCDYVGDSSWVLPIPKSPSELASKPWTVAMGHSVSLQKQVPTAAEAPGLLRLLGGKYVPYFEGMLGKNRSGTLEISNVGRFPSGKETDRNVEGKWHIDEIFFGQCNATFGSAFKLNVVGSQNGSLGLCLNWTEGVVEEDLAQKFADCLKRYIEDSLKRED